MRILIFNWRDPKNPRSGGAEIVTFEHAKSWIKAGNEVYWYTSEFKNSLKKEVVKGVVFIRQGNALTVYLFAPLFYLFSKIEFDLVIDEIHGLPFFTPLYVKKPKIAFIHEVAEEIWDYMYPFPINKIGRFIESFYFKVYKKVVFWTDANSTIDDLVKFGIRRENCKAIPCPINNKCLNKLPIKEKIPTFIFVSRIVKMKGIEEVIKAFKLIDEKIKAQLWIVGDGDKKYINKLKNFVKKNNLSQKITFFNRVTDSKKLKLMRKAHLLLHASIKEGWGLVVLEAASQGTPAIVHNISGLRDTVKDKKTGIVLKENSPKQMANEAWQLLKEKEIYNKLQKNCLIWAKSLTWKKASNESLKLLNTVFLQYKI